MQATDTVGRTDVGFILRTRENSGPGERGGGLNLTAGNSYGLTCF